MSIAIAGSGMSGAYLFRRLVDEGFQDVDLFDVRKNTACGCRPCAWGYAPTAESRRLIAKVVDPSRFELHHSEVISFDGIKIQSDMLTIDKPGLIKELIGDAEVKQGPIDMARYDRVIDATGVSRAYLPPIRDDLIAECAQYRVRSEVPLGFWFRTSSIGYEWCFPLGGDEFHVGFGNLKSDVKSYRPPKEMDGNEISVKVRCKCQSGVRLTAPFYSQPFVKDNKVVGIGESIGAVAPLASDGNLYAMQCGEILLEHWNDLDRYSESVLEKYDWMRKERKALEKLMAGRIPSLLDVRTMKKHSNMVGIEMKTTHILKLFRNMLKK
jgi:flavin-dependent dehydrogenase